MRVDSVSFRGVYREANKQFSPKQYEISKRISDRLTSQDYVDNRGYTPSENLEKIGYDIILSPKENNAVSVNAVKGLKKGIGIQPHTYRESVFVGLYDEKSEFSPRDINVAINSNGAWGYAFAVPVVAFLGLIASGIFQKCFGEHQNEIKTEKSIMKDSVADSVKILNLDNFRFIKK